MEQQVDFDTFPDEFHGIIEDRKMSMLMVEKVVLAMIEGEVAIYRLVNESKDSITLEIDQKHRTISKEEVSYQIFESEDISKGIFLDAASSPTELSLLFSVTHSLEVTNFFFGGNTFFSVSTDAEQTITSFNEDTRFMFFELVKRKPNIVIECWEQPEEQSLSTFYLLEVLRYYVLDFNQVSLLLSSLLAVSDKMNHVSVPVLEICSRGLNISFFLFKKESLDKTESFDEKTVLPEQEMNVDFGSLKTLVLQKYSVILKSVFNALEFVENKAKFGDFVNLLVLRELLDIQPSSAKESQIKSELENISEIDIEMHLLSLLAFHCSSGRGEHLKTVLLNRTAVDFFSLVGEKVDIGSKDKKLNSILKKYFDFNTTFNQVNTLQIDIESTITVSDCPVQESMIDQRYTHSAILSHIRQLNLLNRIKALKSPNFYTLPTDTFVSAYIRGVDYCNISANINSRMIINFIQDLLRHYKVEEPFTVLEKTVSVGPIGFECLCDFRRSFIDEKIKCIQASFKGYLRRNLVSLFRWGAVQVQRAFRAYRKRKFREMPLEELLVEVEMEYQEKDSTLLVLLERLRLKQKEDKEKRAKLTRRVAELENKLRSQKGSSSKEIATMSISRNQSEAELKESRKKTQVKQGPVMKSSKKVLARVDSLRSVKEKKDAVKSMIGMDTQRGDRLLTENKELRKRLVSSEKRYKDYREKMSKVSTRIKKNPEISEVMAKYGIMFK